MDDFVFELETEATEAGFQLDARKLMGLIGSGFGPRPEMAHAIDIIRAHGLRTAALTNNWAHDDERAAPHMLHDAPAFDVFVESAREGLRKPDPRIYALVLARLDVLGPEAVFLDDLGINLKPARAMGMTTIKVTNPDAALAELEAVLGFEVR
jgi:epoxide hydrolase-like predicted phosphatase